MCSFLLVSMHFYARSAFLVQAGNKSVETMVRFAQHKDIASFAHTSTTCSYRNIESKYYEAYEHSWDRRYLTRSLKGSDYSDGAQVCVRIRHTNAS